MANDERRTWRIATATIEGDRMMKRSRILVAVLLLFASSARADKIRLKGGGEIKGVVVKDPSKPDSVFVQTETAAKLLAFPKNGIASVVREAGPLDDYIARKGSIEKTAQAHFDFGLWCEDVKLRGPADAEYHAAVAIEPEFGPAHKKLGHVQHGTRWLTYDQQREAQGLTKYKGKWVAKAEKEKVDAAASLGAEQASWATRIKVLRNRLYDPDAAARTSAESQINEIRDPAAIPGLFRAFANDNDAVRIRLAQLISAIPGPEATDAVINLFLIEADDDVRQSMLSELIHRRDPDTASKLIAVLKGKETLIVGRAALALAEMKQSSAVPRLIDALIQSDKKLMMVAMPAENGGGGALSGSFGMSQNLSSSSGFAGGVPLAANRSSSSSTGVVAAQGAGSQGFGTFYSQPYLTGPAVGPGVVAFGATSAPMVAGGAASVSGPPQQMSQMPAKVNVRTANAAVLKALQALTGMNFGFDQAAWKKWMNTEFREEDQAPRRVPKP